MKPAEYDIVQLLRALPEHNLHAGAEGTVVMDYSEYSQGDVPPAFEVEFPVADGRTQAIVTVPEEHLEVVQRATHNEES